jgi:hypothetical protein
MAAAQLICPTGCLKNSLSSPQVIEPQRKGIFISEFQKFRLTAR